MLNWANFSAICFRPGILQATGVVIQHSFLAKEVNKNESKNARFDIFLVTFLKLSGAIDLLRLTGGWIFSFFYPERNS
jgi:hypothetical protein